MLKFKLIIFTLTFFTLSCSQVIERDLEINSASIKTINPSTMSIEINAVEYMSCTKHQYIEVNSTADQNEFEIKAKGIMDSDRIACPLMASTYTIHKDIPRSSAVFFYFDVDKKKIYLQTP